MEIFIGLLVLTCSGWLAISWSLARVGGWAKLANSYPDDGTSSSNAVTYRMRTGKVGAVAYSGCLKIRIGDAGLGLSVLPPFRFCHPPIFIPWSEFHEVLEYREMVFFRFVRASIGKPPVAKISLPLFVRQHITDHVQETE